MTWKQTFARFHWDTLRYIIDTVQSSMLNAMADSEIHYDRWPRTLQIQVFKIAAAFPSRMKITRSSIQSRCYHGHVMDASQFIKNAQTWTISMRIVTVW